MSAGDLVLGISIGILITVLIILRRIPAPARGGLPPHPTPAAEVEALREELAAAVDADRGWTPKMEAPGYAVRALEESRPRMAEMDDVMWEILQATAEGAEMLERERKGGAA